MTPPLRHPVRPRHVRRQRRGIALLLVLIAMATATTLTLGWLASQDNASIVGRNIATAAEARALACSGIDLAASITQTESVWRDVGADGILMQHYPIGEGTIDLSVLDQATNMPPTAATTDLLVTATGRIGPLAQVVTASISLLEDEDGSVHGEVDDFALFALGAIELSNHASVLRWADAPASSLGRRIAIGTAERRAHAVQLRGKSNVIDGTLYQHGSASPAHFINRTQLDVPVVPTELSLTLDGAGDTLPPNVEPTSVHRHARSDSNGDDVVIRRNQTVRWNAGDDLSIDGDLIIESGARILISGPAELQVGGNLIMDDSAILLRGDATLEVVVHGQVDLDDARIGHKNGGWTDPDRIQFRSEDDAETADTWRLDGNTSMTGIIEGSGIDLILEDNATVQGRLAANTIHMRDHSQVLFDHGLGDGLGLARAADLLKEHHRRGWKRSNRLSSLPRNFLTQLLEMQHGGNMSARNEPVGNANVSNWRLSATPRPIAVEVRILAHGVDPEEWEDAARLLTEASQ